MSSEFPDRQGTDPWTCRSHSESNPGTQVRGGGGPSAASVLADTCVSIACGNRCVAARDLNDLSYITPTSRYLLSAIGFLP